MLFNINNTGSIFNFNFVYIIKFIVMKKYVLCGFNALYPRFLAS